MPGGLGRSSGFHSDLNRGCGTYLDGKWKVWGVWGGRMCVCGELFSFQAPNWKIVPVYKPWLKEVRELKRPPCFITLKKPYYTYALQVSCWPGML